MIKISKIKPSVLWSFEKKAYLQKLSEEVGEDVEVYEPMSPQELQQIYGSGLPASKSVLVGSGLGALALGSLGAYKGYDLLHGLSNKGSVGGLDLLSLATKGNLSPAKGASVGGAVGSILGAGIGAGTGLGVARLSRARSERRLGEAISREHQLALIHQGGESS